MRRFIITAAALVAPFAAASTACAEPPEHDMTILKDVAVTVPPPAECVGPAASIDIVFNQQAHLTFTDDTFHYTETSTGTWTSRDPAGAELASGRYTATLSAQGPGFPTLTQTDALHATGRTVDGDPVRVTVLRHITITPDGDVVSEFEQISCL